MFACYMYRYINMGILCMYTLDSCMGLRSNNFPDGQKLDSDYLVKYFSRHLNVSFHCEEDQRVMVYVLMSVVTVL